MSSILAEVKKSAKKKILFLPHAVRQMSRTERMITTLEIKKIIYTGKLVEDYPNDPRGHSCLILGVGNNNRNIHVVCAPKNDYLAVITAYIPSEDEWDSKFILRKKK